VTGDLPRRRVFISFVVEDRHYASLMDAWAANENNEFDFYDERLKVAIGSHDAEYVKSRLRPKIDRASVLMCLIGDTTSQSAWVNWEIEYAKRQGKGLVGVELGGKMPRPSQISDSGAIFVPYSKDEVLRGIERSATTEKTSGDWVFSE